MTHIPTAEVLWHNAATISALAIFVSTYLFTAVGKLFGYHLDRAGAALLGASLMVWLGVLSLEDSYTTISALAIKGVLMTALPFGILAVLLLAAIVLAFVLDGVKLVLFKRLAIA